MDIKSVIVNEFSNATSLYSLILQNHIYGCFIMMEDIAQEKFKKNGSILSTSTFTFDYDKKFSEIGIRYGFVMDTKLKLDTFTPEYKEVWIKQFNDIDLSHNIQEVDNIEDSLIEVIRSIKPEDSFFINALETGSLSQEWVDKVLQLLYSDDTDSDEIECKNAISNAITEKPIRKTSKTRRAKRILKKPLSKTRRHIA